MLTKAEFLAGLKRETKILSHLAGRLQAEHLEFRFTPPQRSTIELLQYLTINAQASVGYYLSGSWGHWDALDAAAKEVTPTTFPAALKAQERAVAKLLKPISDRTYATKLVRPMSGKGASLTLADALYATTLTMSVGYRMQLFLQAKAAGLADLKSSDLWAGKPS